MTDDVPLEACDVNDKERLAVYRFFRRQWLAMLSGEDEHAIVSQIRNLFSVDLEFRSLNFARKLADEESVNQNGLLHDFIDRGFVAHQVMTIRRVTEDFDGPKKKAVFSLRRIISEMQEQADLMTREMYVCVDGDKYDWMLGGWKSALRHRAFDELSRVAADARRREDRIHQDEFHELRGRFKSSEAVRAYANKVLAHAADPSTRSGKIPLKLADFDAAYKDLAWITRRLCTTFLYGAEHVFLPTYNYDVFAGIANPVCPPGRVEHLWEFWSERCRQLEAMERGDRPS